MEEVKNVPRHVAIIMDGNGRWAKARKMPRSYGHIQGAKTVEQICEDAYNMGIEYLTVYAFSTENWSRPDDEVSQLMTLLRNYMKTCIQRASKNNMKVRVIGDKTRLDDDIQKSIADLEEATKDYTGLKFTIAINYGSRDEIRRAVTDIAGKVKEGIIDPSDIDEEMISDALDTSGYPDPDLLVRTCGELRISNFLLWQISYSEIYVTDVAWPDFDKEQLRLACEAYAKRTRRFGKVLEEE
ncbi:MAG: isoprenyl transferase [Lachnospiraceae bacterium]|nr:isoprenyl transferase [Lachnospiraceae bacterium]